MFRPFLVLFAMLVSASAGAQAVRAPEFSHLPEGARIVLMPPDVELFSLGAGGVSEPMAQWTEQARGHLLDSLRRREAESGGRLHEIDHGDADTDALNTLHGSVANAIALHHYYPPYSLPTKDKTLRWHIGADTAALRERSGADYALFIFIRDSYATGERKATMFLAALFGVGLQGGAQIGYASLVDLNTGDIVWFNRLLRMTGDLREATAAEESVTALLDKFPR